jgi:hypothetical protein
MSRHGQRFKLVSLILRWLARGTSALSIAIILLFFVGFRPSQVAAREWIGLMFFPLGVVLGMLISWKSEMVGSIVSLTSLAAFYFFYELMITGRLGGWAFLVFTAPAFLFLISWITHKAIRAKREPARR